MDELGERRALKKRHVLLESKHQCIDACYTLQIRRIGERYSIFFSNESDGMGSGFKEIFLSLKVLKTIFKDIRNCLEEDRSNINICVAPLLVRMQEVDGYNVIYFLYQNVFSVFYLSLQEVIEISNLL